jgi:hypothetical protein
MKNDWENLKQAQYGILRGLVTRSDLRLSSKGISIQQQT